MIIRVIIHIDTVGRDDLDRSERIYFHSCKTYNDEKTALEETDKELENFNLNDGCSLSSSEDFISLNGNLAERFDDCYNQDAYATWDDIEEVLINQCHERFCEHHWELGLLLKIAEELDIDINGI
jgi:hypothetical protein